LRRDLVRLNNQLESLLEEAHIKLSSLVSDLLGVSARGMLNALADGETNPAALAALAAMRPAPSWQEFANGICSSTHFLCLQPVNKGVRLEIWRWNFTDGSPPRLQAAALVPTVFRRHLISPVGTNS
jgi:hypothetical protein